MTRHLRSVATEVRAQAETRGAAAGFPEGLCGFCALGSRLLFRALKREGLSPELVLAIWPEDHFAWYLTRPTITQEQYSHCYVLCEGYVLDVTASQFGQPNVVVRRKHSAARERFWRPSARYRSEGGLIYRLRRDGWGEGHLLLSKAEF